MDVVGGREVDGAGHGAEAVDAHEVVFERDGGGLSAVEFARYGGVLDVERFGICAYDKVWF